MSWTVEAGFLKVLLNPNRMNQKRLVFFKEENKEMKNMKRDK